MMESFDARLTRFLFNSPNEIFFTILNSFDNFVLPELRRVAEAQLFNLAFLGVHAVAQTISDQIYGRTGVDATRYYLESFVDGPGDEVRFADIADQLHSFRNVHAHRWSSRSSHSVGFDRTIAEGWLRDGDGLHVNPVVFMNRFSFGFRAGGPMWHMPRALDTLFALHRKYRYLRNWLELERADTLHTIICSLEQSETMERAVEIEPQIQAEICARFDIRRP